MRALSVLVCGSMLVAAGSAHADETRFTTEVNSLVDAENAENSLCRGYPGGTWLSDSACSRRDEIHAYIKRKGYCYDSKSGISADDDWRWCGKGRAPKD